jgi:drug/metabolite transporter (DMT)-like permease
MRRILALLLAASGLWWVVAGVLSVTRVEDASDGVVPTMGAGIAFGCLLLAAAALLWRQSARRSRSGTA